MSWNVVRPVLVDLLALQARIARLQLLDKLAAAEVHFRAAGLDPSPINDARNALLGTKIPSTKAVTNVKRLQHIVVDGSQHGD